MALQRQAGNRAVASLVPSTPQETVLQRGILDDVAGVAGDVKGRVLGQFGTWARRIPGYGVLCVALGKDPITQQPVARDATAIVGALVGLVPGGAALWENLQQSGAVAKAGEWLSAELPKLGLTWESIRALFARAWDAVSVTDLIDPSAVWNRLSGIFSDPIARLRTFASAAGTKLMELVFEGVLGGAGGIGGQVMGIIHRAGDVIGTIVRNPIGFAGNLVNAVRGGLGQFVTNVLTHLRTGLFGWLTGALRGAVQIPQRFDFGGILSMVASMLGLTWQWLRERLVRTLGERTVRLVETGVDWVRDIATRGLAAVSQRLGDMASGFVDTVIGGIRDWVANSIVGAAITRLISMFNPAGAVIQAILAVYNTIRFFIERAQQLGALAESVFGSIAAIASGSLDTAKNAVEQALGRAVPVVLGFLARLIGLGDVAAPVRNVVTRIRGAVDRAADRVIGWVSGVARRLTGRGGAPAAEGQSPQGNQTRDLSGLMGSQTVAMKGHTHTVTLEKQNGSHVVMMASEKERLSAKLYRALQDQEVQKNSQVVEHLHGVQASLREYEDKIHQHERVAPNERELNRVRAEVETYSRQMISQLAMIGRVMDIDILKGGVYVLDNKVHPDYDASIRRTFYGPESAYQAHRNTLMAAQIALMHSQPQWASNPMFGQGTYVCPGASRGGLTKPAHLMSQADGAVDHKTPVVSHWRTNGRNESQGDREEWYQRLGNLQILCSTCNGFKGGGGENFEREVGATFTGPNGLR